MASLRNQPDELGFCTLSPGGPASPSSKDPQLHQPVCSPLLQRLSWLSSAPISGLPTTKRQRSKAAVWWYTEPLKQ